MSTGTYFWEGYEPLLVLGLLVLSPLMGFAVGYGRGGRVFVSKTWRWLAAYYIIVAISIIPVFLIPVFLARFLVVLSCFVWMAGPLLAAIFIAEGSLLKPRPATGPLCAYCGYNLTGNVSGICPECGEPIHGEPDADLFTEDPAAQAEGDLSADDEKEL